MRSNVLFFGLALIFIALFAGCTNTVVCNKPYILVGSACCLDANDNGICDTDEPITTTTTSTTSTTTEKIVVVSTTKPTTTTTTTTSTTTTKPISPYLSMCGQPFCTGSLSGKCTSYDIIKKVWVNESAYTMCDNLSLVYNCSKDAYCYMSNITGAACKLKHEKSVPSNIVPSGR